MGYGTLLFPDTGCPIPHYVSAMIDVWDTVSTFIYLPWMFSPHGQSFLNNGFDYMQWTSFT